MKRPVPDDFAEVASRLTYEALQNHYRAGTDTIRRWISQAGMPARVAVKYPVPDDFREVAPAMSPTQLQRRYGVSSSVIARWEKAAGIKIARRPPRAVPDDFAAIAPTMTRTAMIRHYKADIRTINRWISETGVEAATPAPGTPPWRQRGVYNITPTRSRPPGGNMTITRTTTIHEDAARVIGRHMPAYRCDERGRAKLDGKLWRVGNVICTPDEMLDRAARYERAA